MANLDPDFQALLRSPGASALYANPETPRLRVRTYAVNGGVPQATITQESRPGLYRMLPAKEWAINDDVLNVADTASVTIANDEGQNSGTFQVGQRIELDTSDAAVANGQWVRQFTGLITSIDSFSDLAGGSNIQLTAMDLGWYITSCHGPPLVNIKGITFDRLLQILIDPSWGMGPIRATNSLNTRLKYGRQLVVQNFQPQIGAILPYIQVEPGQTPFDILRTYATREGVLINVGARGELIFFRPDYTLDSTQIVQYHATRDARSRLNNVIGRPGYRETIDGLYSEVQCWSTVVIPPAIQNTENPNESYRHTTYTLQPNPLPFFRRHVFSDGEAITERLRMMRAVWKSQMDQFNSYSYECEFPAHSQNGGYFVSNLLVSVNDSVHGVYGQHYVQSVRRSVTLSGGTRAKLTLRKPGLLNPDLQRLDYGGGTRRAGPRKKKAAS